MNKKCAAASKLKSCYSSRERAQLSADQRSTRKMKLYVYECKVCGDYHLTRQKQPERKPDANTP